MLQELLGVVAGAGTTPAYLKRLVTARTGTDVTVRHVSQSASLWLSSASSLFRSNPGLCK